MGSLFSKPIASNEILTSLFILSLLINTTPFSLQICFAILSRSAFEFSTQRLKSDSI